MAVIALDLGGTKLSGAIMQPDGKVIHKVVHPLDMRGGEEAGRFIIQAIGEQIGYAHSHGHPVEAIGCCVPGIVYTGEGTVWAPNIAGWDNFPLLGRIHQSLHHNPLRVTLDNDRACSIMGEVWQGSARGCKNAIFLAVGTGIGAGIMIDGSILRGASDIAGSIGWLALDNPYQEKYRGLGCFEYHASGDGLPRVARELLQHHKGYEGMLNRVLPEQLTAHHIFDAYREHDPIARQVVDHAVIYWGMTIANLVSLFNPEKIVLGGGVFGPALMFLDAILAEARKWAQPISMQQVSLEPSALSGDAGLIGAGYLALHPPS